MLKKAIEGSQLCDHLTASGLVPALARLCDQHGLAEQTGARYAECPSVKREHVVRAAFQVWADKKWQWFVLRSAEAAWLDAELGQLPRQCRPSSTSRTESDLP